MIGIDYIKYTSDNSYRVKRDIMITKFVIKGTDQINMDLVQAYRDWLGCDHVLRSQTHFMFCQTIQEEQIEMELIQQQANDNTFDVLTGKITMEELFESNNDSIPLLVQAKDIVNLEDRLDVLEGMIEYYTEGEEYEKCAKLVKLKNKLWS